MMAVVLTSELTMSNTTFDEGQRGLKVTDSNVNATDIHFRDVGADTLSGGAILA